MSVAAGFLLLVFFYVIYLQMEGTPNLYADFEYTDPGIPIQMSQSPDFALLNALTFYNEGNYEETIAQLQALEPTVAPNDTIRYFLGASFLYQGQTTEARNYFTNLAGTDNERFGPRAEWLMALSYLQDNDIENTRTSLTPILENPEHPFFESAQALLNVLP